MQLQFSSTITLTELYDLTHYERDAIHQEESEIADLDLYTFRLLLLLAPIPSILLRT